MKLYTTFIAFLIIASCKNPNKETLFSLQENTGIDFVNRAEDSKETNIFNYRNFYNGGGVALGDINNDGLPDIFFTANQGSNKLYLNKGNLKFEDISGKAGFVDKKQWSTGVVMVDINGDGWLDIFVCNAGNMMDSSLRRNQLFINNHDLTFTESAKDYGLDNTGYTTQATFFDYDMDGDLDCFIVNNSPIPINTLNYANKRDLPSNQWPIANFLKGGGDHLYRNDNGKFTEVTYQSGIHGSLISFGLGVTVGDVNGDGWPDIYVSNDFFERDYLYINQQNGKFKDELEERMQHTSLASMGADFADINNDGYPDFFTTDMLPYDNYRLKTTTSFDNIDVYRLKESYGFYHQFMQNTVQLNNKNGKFSEIANYSGVKASDWSWGGLMFDADNDGYNDLYICNGIYRDLTNQDFIDFFANGIIQKMVLTGRKDDIKSIIDKMSSVPLKNKVFRNMGDLHFEDVGDKWGFTQTTFSNGAAYGDLDGDGDLDLVINNLNQPASIYRNNSNNIGLNNYISFRLQGIDGNTFAIGAKIKVFANNQIFTREIVPSRGFQSSMDYKAIIGLGKINKIDSVQVIWPNRAIENYADCKINNTNIIKQAHLKKEILNTINNKTIPTPLLQANKANFEKHEENDFIELYNERNIPQMLSKEGPKATVGDVNGDGLQDIYICGANNKGGKLYIQNKHGGFNYKPIKAFLDDASIEGTSCLFFDCDGDGDLDLIVGAGGDTKTSLDKDLQTHLYINDGNGNFTLKEDEKITTKANAAVILAFDYDGDGDLDLFIGGRNMSFNYGANPNSYILANNGKGKFTDVTNTIAKEISNIGMVTGAAWGDITGNGQHSLIIVGDYMYPHIFSYKNNYFQETTSNLFNLFGWWRNVQIADLNGDGKNDLILGNIGENFYLHPSITQPVKLWLNDYDKNGNIEKILTSTINGKDIPVFLKHDMEEQLPALKKQNLTHEVFANKSIQDLFTPDLIKSSTVRIFNYCSSIIAWNNGNGNFTIQILPKEIQFSSANAILCTDLNGDNIPDLVIGGNEFGFPPQFGRLDASYGNVLINNGNKSFTVLDNQYSGVELTGMIRDIKEINSIHNNYLLFLRNSDYPVLYQIISNKKSSTK